MRASVTREAQRQTVAGLASSRELGYRQRCDVGLDCRAARDWPAGEALGSAEVVVRGHARLPARTVSCFRRWIRMAGGC